MKKYQKSQMLAKNLPSGSYAAGCGENQRAPWWSQNPDRCYACERTM